VVLSCEEQERELVAEDDMMDKQIQRTPKGFNLNWVFIAITLAMMLPSCAEREPMPVVMPDSTIVFPAKDTSDISAKITFSRYFGQKTGRQWGISSVFPIKEDENVYAVIELENRLKNLDRDLMFHLDWLRPDGQSVYRKETILPAGDSTITLESSVSSSPASRQPGNYSLRVYLFRELIAEKQFELRPENEVEKGRADIIFYKSLDKETGEMKGVDTVFEIKKKGILRAQVNIVSTGVYKDEELQVKFEWIGPDGKDFYSKKIDYTPADSISVINTSISITPDKREPGEYLLRVYLFDEILGEEKFALFAKE
jgi:hypothetical protein